jgi:hypothetical protein
MHGAGRPGTTETANGARPPRQPRVVIFDLAGRASVEVLELDEAASLGTVIHHGGRSWRVTGIRTGGRVLIAEPEAN